MCLALLILLLLTIIAIKIALYFDQLCQIYTKCHNQQVAVISNLMNTKKNKYDYKKNYNLYNVFLKHLLLQSYCKVINYLSNNCLKKEKQKHAFCSKKCMRMLFLFLYFMWAAVPDEHHARYDL